MQFDIELIRAIYGSFSEKVKRARAAKGAPLTLAEKILYAHLFDPSSADRSAEARTMWTSAPTGSPCRTLRPKWLCCNS